MPSSFLSNLHERLLLGLLLALRQSRSKEGSMNTAPVSYIST